MTAQADLVVVNARVLTMDEGNPRAEAMAIGLSKSALYAGHVFASAQAERITE